MKNIKIYLRNIFLVLFIFLFTLIFSKTSPFGKGILGLSDGISQFKPMLFDFITKFKLGILESYTFNNGLGNPTIFNLLYYLSSPVNLIALLFNKPDYMYLAVILVKMTIATITMTFYVSHKTERKEIITIAKDMGDSDGADLRVLLYDNQLVRIISEKYCCIKARKRCGKY